MLYIYIGIFLNKFILYTFNYLHNRLSKAHFDNFLFYTIVDCTLKMFTPEHQFKDVLQHQFAGRRSRMENNKVLMRWKRYKVMRPARLEEVPSVAFRMGDIWRSTDSEKASGKTRRSHDVKLPTARAKDADVDCWVKRLKTTHDRHRLNLCGYEDAEEALPM